MAWRNVQQAISASIPQNIITDPEGFITAYNNAYSPQQKEQAYGNYVFPTWNGGDTRDIVSERLLGDSTNYINISGDANNYLVQPYYNGSAISWAQSDFKTSDYTACYVALVDDDTQNSFFSVFIRYRNNQACGQCSGTVPTTSGTASQQIYTILTANEYHQYTWSSVPAISGKNGILSLTMIKDEKIEEGSNQHIVLPDDNIARFTDQSNIRKLCLNHVANEWFIAGESGLNRIELKYRLSGSNNDIMLVDFKFINHYGEGNNQYYSEVYSGSIYYSPPLDGSADAYLAFIIDEDNEVAQFDPVTQYKLASATPPIFGVDYGYLQPTDQQMAALYYFLKGSPEDIDEDDPYADGSEGDGGDGNPYQPQDHLGLSSKPTKSGLNLGLVTLYNPDETELAAIAQFLWSDDTLENFKKYFNNFADNLMALYILPVTPEAASKASKVFKVGNLTSESASLQSVDYITDRYADIDMGAFYIKRKWDSYLDVSPYTKLEIYLPYCGTHQLNTDEIMYPANQQGFLPTVPDEDIKLELNYRIDLVTGNIVATLFVNDENRYQFTGKCGMSVPLTGANYNNMVQGALTAGAGLAATIASGGLTAPLSASAAVSGTVMAQKPEVYRSGNLSGDVSMLGFNTPYLIKTIPNKPALVNQELYTGFPSYKKGTLGEFSGYTEVIEAHIDDVSCTSEERDMIMAALKGGVII